LSSTRVLMNPPMESSKAGSGAVIPAFYPILDTQAAARHLIEPVGAAEQLIEAGVEILQFRHKAHFSRRVFELMQRIAEMCRSARVQFVVNDRADLAVLLEAALHLGQDDLTPSAAREVTGPGTLIGYSTHNEAQLRAAETEPADYLALGPIFGTGSKERPDPVVGIGELRRLRPLANRPLVAIGGITLDRAADVLAAGADSIAVIGDLFTPDRKLRARAEEWIRVTRAARAG
jgi:thiamine-phosphate pyrophosphorylase